jgi:hypothetical protein
MIEQPLQAESSETSEKELSEKVAQAENFDELVHIIESIGVFRKGTEMEMDAATVVEGAKELWGNMVSNPGETSLEFRKQVMRTPAMRTALFNRVTRQYGIRDKMGALVQEALESGEFGVA